MGARILVSACLMGHAVRYDGRATHASGTRSLARGRAAGDYLSGNVGGHAGTAAACGNRTGKSAAEVLSGGARVLESNGDDVTAEFRQAAENALAVALETGCAYALLIDGSPSCGSGFIYDGSFSGRRRPGEGVTAALLKAHGIQVFSGRDIDALVEVLGSTV
ncbi:DUF523 domain-containing protein [Rhizobium herbae]|uniref:DUF523 domain-containing protein n=1 Tax=Rhizobium herbae TaxID=508661 RepID=A0ABS7H9Q8_9HYPH|nr:DUF523 domain-containing protein [Rhizobium herbae]MBW9063942.1 DUF523 domain-containing protein [Rhizobium herbae]